MTPKQQGSKDLRAIRNNEVSTFFQLEIQLDFPHQLHAPPMAPPATPPATPPMAPTIAPGDHWIRVGPRVRHGFLLHQ